MQKNSQLINIKTLGKVLEYEDDDERKKVNLTAVFPIKYLKEN